MVKGVLLVGGTTSLLDMSLDGLVEHVECKSDRIGVKPGKGCLFRRAIEIFRPHFAPEPHFFGPGQSSRNHARPLADKQNIITPFFGDVRFSLMHSVRLYVDTFTFACVDA